MHEYIHTYINILYLTAHVTDCNFLPDDLLHWFEAQSIVVLSLILAVPGEPSAIAVTERMPNSIIIDVDPPKEDGGEKVIGYHVEYEEMVQEFRTGRADDSYALTVEQLVCPAEHEVHSLSYSDSFLNGLN